MATLFVNGIPGTAVILNVKLGATVTLSNLSQTYSGTARSVSATTVPSGLSVSFTYNGSANAPTNVGSYAVVATINDANYAGNATNTLVIMASVALSTPRYVHTATLLPNGKVLVVGGNNGTTSLSSAELYDPSTGTWTLTGSLNTARQSHTATLLPNVKVLVAGGSNGSTLSSAELYDPSTGTWTLTGSLNGSRYAHTATLLANGKVLVAGGYSGGTLSSAELYDPATGIWSTTGSLIKERHYFAAILLPNGKVLVAGGETYNVYAILSSAELYDPVAGTWTTTGALNTARVNHAATLLPDGKVMGRGGIGSRPAFRRRVVAIRLLARGYPQAR
jgi:WD40 repeat protein